MELLIERTTFRGDRSPAGFVRPLEAGDIARVAELHERVMPKANHPSPDTMRARLSRILLRHPWYTEAMPSLVYEDAGGKVVGCVGVMSRPMFFGDRPITAAISHSFIVEPGSRSGLAALELAKRFLAGPQDLSLAEGGAASRKIWEKVGGAVSLLYSLCWTRPLRPSRYVLSFLRRRGLPRAIGWGLWPLCQLVDALAPIAGRPFRLAAPAATASELDAQTFSQSVSIFTRDRSLRPQYDLGACNWLFETLAESNGRDGLQKVVVRNGRAEVIGWYVYLVNAGGIGAVAQIGARDGEAEVVLEHLFHHARRHGAVAVSGQVDPALFHALSRRDCLFHHDGGSWMLIHSRHPEIVQAIHRGDAFLTRLDGEWWISFVLG